MNVLIYPFFLGISGKTQLLYAFVYTSRYLDVFTDGLPANTPGKLVYIILGYISVITIFFLFRKSYERKHDTCRLFSNLQVIILLRNISVETIL